MKTIIYILLSITLFSCSEIESRQNNDDSPRVQLTTDAHYSIPEIKSSLKNFKLEKGANLVFAYSEKGTTFLNSEDYDPVFTESLIIEFSPDQTDFKLKDQELKNLNCKYVWTVISKIPKREVRNIEKGTISGQKISDDTWEIEIDIDTQFKFGGQMDGQSSRKIKLKEKIKTVPNIG